MDLVDRLRGVLGNAEGKVFDNSVKLSDRQCSVCDSIFGTVVRRLACRLCGRAVCQECAKNGVPAPVGSSEPVLRACDYCKCPGMHNHEMGSLPFGLAPADWKHLWVWSSTGFHMRQRPRYDADYRSQALAVASAYSGWVSTWFMQQHLGTVCNRVLLLLLSIDWVTRQHLGQEAICCPSELRGQRWEQRGR